MVGRWQPMVGSAARHLEATIFGDERKAGLGGPVLGMRLCGFISAWRGDRSHWKLPAPLTLGPESAVATGIAFDLNEKTIVMLMSFGAGALVSEINRTHFTTVMSSRGASFVAYL